MSTMFLWKNFSLQKYICTWNAHEGLTEPWIPVCLTRQRESVTRSSIQPSARSHLIYGSPPLHRKEISVCCTESINWKNRPPLQPKRHQPACVKKCTDCRSFAAHDSGSIWISPGHGADIAETRTENVFCFWASPEEKLWFCNSLKDKAAVILKIGWL